jgi:uncharacterized membrane protein YphA (DoxX/SURF4 family)
MLSKAAAVLRILLGAVFCYAAYSKLRQPWLVFAMSIDAYQILPAWAVLTVARTLPWVELLVGGLLITGIWSKYAASAATGLLLVFYVAMWRAFSGAAGIDCGCFGIGEALSAATLTRDGLLLGCSLLLSFLLWRRAARDIRWQ